MKTAITVIKQPQSPPAPRKGDIEACKQYAKHLADNSPTPQATLAHIWVKFIQYSYLQDKAPGPTYTGWKTQQKQLAELKVVQS